MDLPDIQFNTPIYHLNLTVLMSIIAFCLTAMATIIKVFGPKKDSDDESHITKDIEKLQKFADDQNDKNQELKDITAQLEKEVAVLQKESEISSKSLEEIRESNRQLAVRLDDMIRQLIDYASN